MNKFVNNNNKKKQQQTLTNLTVILFLINRQANKIQHLHLHPHKNIQTFLYYSKS